MAGLSFLRVVSDGELQQQEAADLRHQVDERQNQPLILGLVAHLKENWEAARAAKLPIERSMLASMRQRQGEYEADKMTAIRNTGGSTLYMLITEVKCRAAESWLRDILLDTGSPPWDLEPTPIPDMGEEQDAEIEAVFEDKLISLIQETGTAPDREIERQLREMIRQDLRFAKLEEANSRAQRMKLRIEDQFAQGGWSEAFDAFITDLVTFPAAFLKGPCVRRQRSLSWVRDETGKMDVEVEETLAPEYDRVDPFRIYPEPGITDINDGYMFEHHPLSRSDLADLIGVPGYDSDAIRQVLMEGTSASWVTDHHEHVKNELERKHHVYASNSSMYDALEFWGKVSGKMLREWGMTEEEIPDEAREYDANVWLVGNYAIKAILNYDPLGEKPYTKTSFIKSPGSFWGRGIPEIIVDLQGVCNAAARALVNNMGIASGPQVEVNVERIPPNEDITQIHPWKIWQVLNDPLGSSAPAIRFTQPEDNAQKLMAVYEKFSRLADDHSGIPSYISGDTDVQGAGRTASGLSMLMGSAGKGIRQVVMHIDNDIIRKIVKRQFVFNMRYDDDESIKGDVRIVAKGTINLAVKETVNVRRIEFLNATANPLDAEIMGKEGRASILREVAKGLQMPVDDVVPTKEKEAHLTKLASASQMPGPSGQPAPQNVDASGAQQGGQANNTVSSADSGRAG